MSFMECPDVIVISGLVSNNEKCKGDKCFIHCTITSLYLPLPLPLPVPAK